MQISPAAFQELEADEASEFHDGVLKSQFSGNVVPGQYESGTASTDAAVFHLTNGTIGLFEITNRHAADGAIEFRCKTVSRGDNAK